MLICGYIKKITKDNNLNEIFRIRNLQILVQFIFYLLHSVHSHIDTFIGRINRSSYFYRTYDKKKKQLERLKEQLTKLEVQATDREENKEIALGTSKLNYLDPRISVAW